MLQCLSYSHIVLEHYAFENGNGLKRFGSHVVCSGNSCYLYIFARTLRFALRVCVYLWLFFELFCWIIVLLFFFLFHFFFPAYLQPDEELHLYMAYRECSHMPIIVEWIQITMTDFGNIWIWNAHNFMICVGFILSSSLLFLSLLYSVKIRFLAWHELDEGTCVCNLYS